jgi:hypothetical protein
VNLTESAIKNMNHAVYYDRLFIRQLKLHAHLLDIEISYNIVRQLSSAAHSEDDGVCQERLTNNF